MNLKQISAVFVACYITRDTEEMLVKAYLMSIFTRVSCLFPEQNFPFVNTTIIDESSHENLVCIDDSVVGETTE